MTSEVKTRATWLQEKINTKAANPCALFRKETSLPNERNLAVTFSGHMQHQQGLASSKTGRKCLCVADNLWKWTEADKDFSQGKGF